MSELSTRPILFVISGPSGSGKRTLITHITNNYPSVERIATYTTRSPRPEEVPGFDYTFTTSTDFMRRVENGEIFEYTRTYGDHLYGSPRRLLELSDEKDTVVELDYKGMLRVKASTARRVVSIFILPPSIEALSDRIEQRWHEHNLQERLRRVAEQLQFSWAYDYVLVNDQLNNFLEEASIVVRGELIRRKGCLRLLSWRNSQDPTLI